MKKSLNLFFCIFFLIAVTFPATGGTVYVVENVRNTVKVKKNKSFSWIPLNRLNKIGLLDSIEVAPDGKLVFFNAGDGRKYSVEKGKKIRVSDIVGKTRNEGSKGVIASVISTGFTNMSKERRRPAASNRGSGDADPTAIAIYNALLEGKSSNTGAWLQKQQGDNSIRFTIGNSGPAIVYAELYAIRKSDGYFERINLMDEANLPLVAGAEIELPYEFADATQGFSYLLVASGKVFDAIYLTKLFNSSKPMENVSANTPAVTFIPVK
ncbi:MAG: hypothetical protein NC212_03880 [Staphylococcus sp.]|nr:hypothetical protein [Staphylococcus sp.]